MKTVTSAFTALEKQEWPFVFFRLPGENKIQLYYQKNVSLHYTSNLDEDGFVFAPFNKKDRLPYIPSTNKHTFAFTNIPSSNSPKTPYNNSKAKADFIALVEKVKRILITKRFQKIVVSRSFKSDSNTPLETILNRLLFRYPEAMVYLWSHPKVGTWFGATPERLLSKKGDTVQTMALAATQTVKKNNQYHWSAKERNEQALVTQQIVEDLSSFISRDALKISTPYNKIAGNVVHLCTDLQAKIANIPLRQVIDVLHPTPAVGGIPRQQAIDFIDKEEGYDRQYYTGFLGPFSSINTHLFVNLRCAKFSNQRVTLFVGAGITSESEASQEWEETQRKAETLLAAL